MIFAHFAGVRGNKFAADKRKKNSVSEIRLISRN